MLEDIKFIYVIFKNVSYCVWYVVLKRGMCTYNLWNLKKIITCVCNLYKY